MRAVPQKGKCRQIPQLRHQGLYCLYRCNQTEIGQISLNWAYWGSAYQSNCHRLPQPKSVVPNRSLPERRHTGNALRYLVPRSKRQPPQADAGSATQTFPESRYLPPRAWLKAAHQRREARKYRLKQIGYCQQ